jgi:hypothetical protein
MNLIKAPQTDSSVRSAAMSALGMLAQAKPELVTADMIQPAMNLIKAPQTDSSVRSAALSALHALAQAKPELVTSAMLQTWIEIIKDPQTDSSVRSDIILLFIETEATQETLYTIIPLCKTDVDSFLRQSAARMLVVIAIREPAKQNMIRDIFTQLQTSPQPHLRMNGERGLEMLAIGNLLEEARLHPERIQQIFESKLYGYQEDDLQFAASVVLDEINKMENKIKK